MILVTLNRLPLGGKDAPTPVQVNLERVEYIERRDAKTYGWEFTYIQFGADNSITVAETPDEIWALYLKTQR